MMPSYSNFKIIISKRAQKFLDNLSESEHKKIAFKIKELTSINLASLNIKKLKGYQNLYRLKVDSYRIVFALIHNKNIIAIALIGHRKNIYDILENLPNSSFN